MTNRGAAESSVKRAGIVLNEAERLASMSRSLRAEREISFYGDPESGIPPEELYSEDDAREALRKARFVLVQCKGLLDAT